MPLPLLPILLGLGGAGLGAVKGATDGKKDNMLSSMLMGGGLGAAGGLAAPMLGGAMGLGAAKAGAGGSGGFLPNYDNLEGFRRPQKTPLPYRPDEMGAGSMYDVGALRGLAGGGSKGLFSGMMNKQNMLNFAGDALGGMGQQQQPQQQQPLYMPETQFSAGPIAPASNTMMPYMQGY